MSADSDIFPLELVYQNAINHSDRDANKMQVHLCNKCFINQLPVNIQSLDSITLMWLWWTQLTLSLSAVYF